MRSIAQYNNSIERVQWLDIAKGIGIFLVVIGHTGLTKVIATWIWSFHMPLFFILSGFSFTFTKSPSLIKFIKKRIRNLLIPYIIFSLIVYLWSLLINYELFRLNYSELFLGWRGLALWFIPVLFCTEIIYFVISKTLNNILLLFVVIFSLLIGYFFYENNIHFLFKFEVVFTSIFFYYIGNKFLKKIVCFFFKFDTFILFIMSFCFLLLSILLSYINYPGLDMAYNYIGIFYITYVNAVVGTVFIVITSVVIERYLYSFYYLGTVILFLGVNSLIVLSFHQVVLMTYKKLFINFNFMPYFNSSLRHILMWITVFLLAFLINTEFPWILGKNYKKK